MPARRPIMLLLLMANLVSYRRRCQTKLTNVRRTADDVEGVIVYVAQQLDELRRPLCQVRYLCPSFRGASYPCVQLGIQFVQVGNNPAATKFLKELDDNLKKEHKIRVRALQPMVFEFLSDETNL